MRQALVLALLLAGPLFGAGRQLPSVANEAALPASGNTLGDRRGTEDTGIEYWWDGDSWEVMAAEAGAHASTHASGGADALSGTLDVNISGNAATATAATSATNSSSATTASTATALAANGANCSAGSAPLGVDASGAAESCTDFAEAGAITSSGLTMATARLLGRSTASTGAVEEITVGSGLTLASGELSAAGGGGIGGNTGATDDVLLCADGSGGSTLRACSGRTRIGSSPAYLEGAASGYIDGVVVWQDKTAGWTGSLAANQLVITNNNVATFGAFRPETGRVDLVAGVVIGWSSSTNDAVNATHDTTITRASAGIVKIDDALQLDPVASAPVACSSGTSGTIYMDSTSSPDELCVCDGSSYQPVLAGGDCT